ncbi:DUF2398 family protein [Kitasatospora sp. NBC_01287]|uniref:DUF2398 family protein n=1 Tax=Kitasatospora sp. NBC_01287 TaxID=2903573 RepID=UPI00225A3B5D|nr:DUF2398 family protein [Kitasatospora sp. NBC_01287]MCX4745257.1 DUF2398 family protein [Kitasatospora sp. NBC_01287]
MNGGGALGGKPASVALAPGGEVTLTLTSWHPPAASEAATPPARSADHLRELARRLAAATPDEAHELFADAFGLYGARHFGIAPEPTCADLGEVSWWHGPTVGQRSLPGARRARRPGRAAAVPALPGRHRKPEPPAADGPAALAALAAERRAAARMLLAHPLVTANGPQAQAFPVIRRHADWLTSRFAELLGYPLTVGEGFARLTKAALGPTAPRRPMFAGTLGTPERYAALTRALAALLTGPARRSAADLTAVLTAELTAELTGESTAELTVEQPAEPSGEQPAEPSAEPSAEPTVEPAAERDLAAGRAAVLAALAVLTEWQLLTADGGERGTLLVDQELLTAVVAHCCPARPQDPPAPRTTIPVAVRRRLVETPVVLFEELTGLEREWLWESRSRETAVLADFLGLTTEIRQEGIALLDPAGELTDLRLPGPGPLAHAALLLVERLVDQLRPLPTDPPDPAAPAAPVGRPAQARSAAPTGVPIAEALIDGILGDLADEYETGDRVREQHAAHWRRAHLADRAAFRRDVLALLHAMRLIAPTAPAAEACAPARSGWILLPPAARYAAPFALGEAAGTGRHSRR